MSEYGTWFFRTQALQEITRKCIATIALDTHVTSCSPNLRSRVRELISPNDFVIGTNIVHDLSAHWRASPFNYTQMKIKRFPHNCVVLLKRGNSTQKLLKAWLEQMKNGHRDDQQAEIVAVDFSEDLKILGRRGKEVVYSSTLVCKYIALSHFIPLYHPYTQLCKHSCQIQVDKDLFD